MQHRWTPWAVLTAAWILAGTSLAGGLEDAVRAGDPQRTVLELNAYATLWDGDEPPPDEAVYAAFRSLLRLDPIPLESALNELAVVLPGRVVRTVLEERTRADPANALGFVGVLLAKAEVTERIRGWLERERIRLRRLLTDRRTARGDTPAPSLGPEDRVLLARDAAELGAAIATGDHARIESSLASLLAAGLPDLVEARRPNYEGAVRALIGTKGVAAALDDLFRGVTDPTCGSRLIDIVEVVLLDSRSGPAADGDVALHSLTDLDGLPDAARTRLQARGVSRALQAIATDGSDRTMSALGAVVTLLENGEVRDELDGERSMHGVLRAVDRRISAEDRRRHLDGGSRDLRRWWNHRTARLRNETGPPTRRRDMIPLDLLRFGVLVMLLAITTVLLVLFVRLRKTGEPEEVQEGDGPIHGPDDSRQAAPEDREDIEEVEVIPEVTPEAPPLTWQDVLGYLEQDGHYADIEWLTSGGTAWLYKARDIASGELRALKVLDPRHLANGNIRSKLSHEGDILQDVFAEWREDIGDAPGAPPVVRCNRNGLLRGEIPFLDLEYIGPSLSRIIGELKERGEKLHWRTALDVIRRIAWGLSYAHAFSYFHRDIKPDNVLVPEGGTLEERLADARLIDFGIAKDRRQETQINGWAGTIEYMAPEQFNQTFGSIGRKTDIYSLGIMMCELLEGKTPTEGEDPIQMMNWHTTASIPTVKGVPLRVQVLAQGMLAKQPGDRLPGSMEELMLEIDRILEEQDD